MTSSPWCSELPDGAVLFRDDHVIIVDKPARVPSQAVDPSHDDDLPARVKRWIASDRNLDTREVYLGTHQRLDRDTSGVLLYTLRREANKAIAMQLEQRSVAKTYLAVITGTLRARERTLEHWLFPGQAGRMRVLPEGARRPREARRAVTRVRVLERHGDRTLVQLGCDTGRTHQLRAQLAHVGAPIAGDPWYGDAAERVPGTPGALRLLLHASELRLRHPVDQRELVAIAPTPYELTHYLEHGPAHAGSDTRLLRRALSLAREARYRLLRERASQPPTTACRLFHQSADGDAELAVDLYGDYLVAHFLGTRIEARETEVLDVLAELPCNGIYVKRHPRQKNTLGDHLDDTVAPRTPARGTAAPADLVIEERGVPFEVRLADGLRTGIFLDQRDNRERVRSLSEGKRVLNLFAYTGGFSVAALAGGAREATCVDVSSAALAWGVRNVTRIGASARHRSVRSDVFEHLERLERKRERYGLIVLDPPSFSTTKRRRLRVREDYAELAAACLRLLASGGQLLACINHRDAGTGFLHRALREAATAAKRTIARIDDLPLPLDFRTEHPRERASTSVLVTCS